MPPEPDSLCNLAGAVTVLKNGRVLLSSQSLTT